MFKPRKEVSWTNNTWKYSAVNDHGARCLHAHITERGAQVCADRLNQSTRSVGTPQGAYEHAAGYQE